jgi:hypothetical protein
VLFEEGHKIKEEAMLSHHPSPEPVQQARRAIAEALKGLATVKVERTSEGDDIVVSLRRRDDWQAAVSAIEKIGAENDVVRGDHIFEYRGNMVVLPLPATLNELSLPKRPRSV